MNILLVLNDPPYGTERSFNGLRMAHALAKNDGEGEVTVFLMADAVLCAKAGQKTPDGYYNIEPSNACSAECSPPGAAS